MSRRGRSAASDTRRVPARERDALPRAAVAQPGAVARVRLRPWPGG